MKTLLITGLLTLAPLTAAIAQTCSKQSPAHTVALVELYTSEGCSSCPPADSTLRTLGRNFAGKQVGLDQLVPIALHVDYWDYIGWKDRFSSKTFTQRQHWLSARAGSHTVYTPEFFVAGQELRNWSGGVAAAVRRINSTPARADIGITLGKPTAGSVAVQVRAHAAQGGMLFLALYENSLSSAVQAGENRGSTLQHDYVVRQWVGPIAIDVTAAGASASWSQSLAIPAGADAHNLGVAAFVQSERGEVLQALALPVCSA